MSSVPMRQVHEGCSAVSASRATQSRISPPVSTDLPGEISPPLNGPNAGLIKDVARGAHGLDPLDAVFLGREVVEAQRRLHPPGSST